MCFKGKTCCRRVLRSESVQIKQVLDGLQMYYSQAQQWWLGILCSHQIVVCGEEVEG